MIDYAKEKDYCGKVIRDTKRGVSKDAAVVKLSEGGNGNVLVSAPPFSGVEYGDEICFRSSVQHPEGGYAEYLAKERIAGTAFGRKIDIVGHSGKSFRKTLYGIKNKMTSSLQKLLPSSEESLVSGIILGDDERLSAENREAMKRSGTTHITALSGYNIALLAGFLWLPLAFLPKKFRFSAFSAFVIIFVVAVGAEASIVRAAAIAIIFAAAKKFERMSGTIGAILTAAFLIVFSNPRVLVFDLGFQLSFAAFLGIAFVAPKLSKAFGWKSGFLKESVLPSLAAQIAVMPVLLIGLGKFSLVSIIPNILILWIVPFLTIAGFLSAFLGSVWLPLGFLPAKISGVLAEAIFAVVKNFPKLNILLEASISVIVLVALTTAFLIKRKQ